tara:strand:+ start:360 stop:551 length:192 start_codon:yes stop_codon:yes gene_type:complete
MTHPTAVERERLNHINTLMSSLHDCNNRVYEGLVDRDFDSVKAAIDEQMERLAEIRNSVDDEI